MKHRPAEYFQTVASPAAASKGPLLVTVRQALDCSTSWFVPLVEKRLAAGDEPHPAVQIWTYDGAAVAHVTWPGGRQVFLPVDLERLRL